MPIVDGHIRCSRCRTPKPVSEYSPSAVRNGCGNCRVCQQLYSRAYEKADPEKTRAQRRASYGRNIDASRERIRKKQAARRAADPESVREYQRGYRRAAPAELKAKWAATTAGWRKRNPKRTLGYDLARYGLTVDDYEALLAAQGGCCACCGATTNPSGRRLFVDHDHATRAVRGVICHHCNAGIGHLGDTVDGLRRAVAYLERAQQPPTRIAPAMRINLLPGAN